jgi:hypothetical protein
MLPVLRELDLVKIFWDGNFSSAQKLFDAEGKILDEATTASAWTSFSVN